MTALQYIQSNLPALALLTGGIMGLVYCITEHIERGEG